MKYYIVVSNKISVAFYDRIEKRTYYTKNNIHSFKYKNGARFSCQYIPDELITAAELKKYYGITPDNITNFPFLQPVEVNKNKTHWFFGARFADDHAIYFNEHGEKIK